MLEIERQRWVSQSMVRGLLRIAIKQTPDDMDLLAEDDDISRMLFPWKKQTSSRPQVRGADLTDEATLKWLTENASR